MRTCGSPHSHAFRSGSLNLHLLHCGVFIEHAPSSVDSSTAGHTDAVSSSAHRRGIAFEPAESEHRPATTFFSSGHSRRALTSEPVGIRSSEVVQNVTTASPHVNVTLYAPGILAAARLAAGFGRRMSTQPSVAFHSCCLAVTEKSGTSICAPSTYSCLPATANVCDVPPGAVMRPAKAAAAEAPHG